MKAKQLEGLQEQLWLTAETVEKYLYYLDTYEPAEYGRAYEYVRTISWDWWNYICFPTGSTTIIPIKTFHYSKKLLSKQIKRYTSIIRTTVPLRI